MKNLLLLIALASTQLSAESAYEESNVSSGVSEIIENENYAVPEQHQKARIDDKNMKQGIYDYSYTPDAKGDGFDGNLSSVNPLIYGNFEKIYRYEPIVFGDSNSMRDGGEDTLKKILKRLKKISENEENEYIVSIISHTRELDKPEENVDLDSSYTNFFQSIAQYDRPKKDKEAKKEKTAKKETSNESVKTVENEETTGTYDADEKEVAAEKEEAAKAYAAEEAAAEKESTDNEEAEDKEDFEMAQYIHDRLVDENISSDYLYTEKVYGSSPLYSENDEDARELNERVEIAIYLKKFVDPDTDKDGVTDSNDYCPETVLGARVDENGCPYILTLHLQFSFDGDTFEDKRSYDDVMELGTFMKKYPVYRSVIIGHTDSIGKSSYNEKLSKRRAKIVVEALISMGVSKERLSSDGRGESEPVASNKTKDGRFENRRTEVELLLPRKKKPRSLKPRKRGRSD